MKKTKLLFTTAAILLLLLPRVQAQDYLNVVQTNSGIKSFRLDSIDKIVLDENNIHVNLYNGSNSEYSYDIISLLNFLNPLITANEIAAEIINNVDVFYSTTSQEVSVKSDTPIKNISVYNMLGRLLIQRSPNSETARLSMQSLPVGLYIVSVVNVGGRVSKKIIKN